MEITETHSDYTGYGVSCNGATDGSIDVTVTGGTGVYTYAWSNGETTEDISDLGAGVYSVVVTDENGNTVSIEVEITESEAMTISETHSDYTGYGVSCNGATDGSIDVTVTGGTGVYTYAWTADWNVDSNMNASFSDTDCDGNAYPETWIGDDFCDDGSWTFDGNPIFLNCPDFNFDGGDCGAIEFSDSEDLSGLGAGVYTVVATDENGCSVAIEVEISQTEQLELAFVVSDYTGYGVSCNGATDGSIDVTNRWYRHIYICLEHG
jgi:phenolic acid decarboxylase